MNSRIIVLITGLLLSSIFLTAGNALAADSPRYIHFNSITMNPEGPDISFTVEYELDPIAKVYVLLLGTRNIESAIHGLFYNFDDIQVTSLRDDSAEIVAYNVGYQDDEIGGIYFYDSHMLGATVDEFILFPNSDNPERLQNVDLTPNTFLQI